MDDPLTSSLEKPGPTPPQRALPLAVVGLASSIVCGTLAVAALRQLYGEIAEKATWVVLLIWVGAVVALLPLIPAVKAFGYARRRQTSLRAGDLPEARAMTATGRDQATIAVSWSLAVLLCAALVGFASANDGAIAETFLNWDYIQQFWGDVTRAFWVNVRIAVGAEVLILFFGLVLAIMRLLQGPAWRPLRWLSVVYIDAFRALPGIIVLYLVGFGLPLAQVPVLKGMSPMWLAIAALTLTWSAYTAEAYRAGIESIHPSQAAAARSLGLSLGMTLGTVIVPQAVRRIVPILMSNFVGLQKDTALVGVMGVVDAFLQSQIEAGTVFNLSPVMIVSFLFVIITIPQTRFVDYLLDRGQARQAAGV